MTTDVEARHDEAVKAHGAAVARTRALMAAAEQARTAASQAAGEGDRMLSEAASGRDDVTDDALIAAGDAAKRQAAIADIATAKAAAAKRVQQQAQIDALTARRDVIQSDYAGVVTRLISIADEIDSAVAYLQELLEAYATQTQAVQLAFQAAHHHNQHELDPGHHRNDLLNAMSHDRQPRVRVPERLPMFTNVKAELFSVQRHGFNSGQRDVIHALAGRLRQGFGRRVTEAA